MSRSDWQGTIGELLVADVEVESTGIATSSDKTQWTAMKDRDGNLYLTFSMIFTPKAGERLAVIGTVKSHTESTERITRLSECRIAEPEDIAEAVARALDAEFRAACAAE